MEQKNKFPFQVIEGGKKEQIEKTDELAREAMEFLLAYKDYIGKYSKENQELMNYAVELDKLIIFIKVELSKRGINISKINAKEYSENDMRDRQLITPDVSLWEKIKYDSSFGMLKERLERFMDIRKYSLDLVLEIKSRNNFNDAV